MTTKRAKLDSVFQTPAPAPVPETEPLAGATEKRKDRMGRVQMPFWTTEAARKQLRIMAAELDSSQQDLITLALNDLFKKHGKPPIA